MTRNQTRYSLTALLLVAGLLPTKTFGGSIPAKTYDLPVGITPPYEIGMCSEEGPLLFWSKDAGPSHSSTLYSLDLPTQTVRALLKGTSGDILCSPRSHLLAVQLSEGDMTTLIVMNDRGKKIGELQNPETGAFFFPQWTKDGGQIVYEADDPDAGPNSPNAFNALGVLNISPWKHSIFPLHRDAFGHSIVIRDEKALVCVSLNNDDDPSKWRFAIRDLNGRRIELAIAETEELCRFRNRRYFVSRQFELPQGFKIFRSGTWALLASFPGVDRKTNELMVAGRWNPTNEDLIVIERHSYANELTSIALFHVPDSRVIDRVKTNVYSWTPSGEFVVYLQNGKFVFMKVVI
jgi:hypothetical protein